MALNPKLTDLAVSREADAVCALLDGGYLDLYSGAQPASADDPVTTQVRLARLRWGTPAFEAAVGGIALARTITAESDAPASGTALWFRASKSDGTTAVFDGSVGTADCNLNLDSVEILQHAEVGVTGFIYTAPKS
jgi:hypothetical protein